MVSIFFKSVQRRSLPFIRLVAHTETAVQKTAQGTFARAAHVATDTGIITFAERAAHVECQKGSPKNPFYEVPLHEETPLPKAKSKFTRTALIASGMASTP